MRERIGKVFILQSYDYAVVVTGFLMWKVQQQGVPQALETVLPIVLSRGPSATAGFRRDGSPVCVAPRDGRGSAVGVFALSNPLRPPVFSILRAVDGPQMALRRMALADGASHVARCHDNFLIPLCCTYVPSYMLSSDLVSLHKNTQLLCYQLVLRSCLLQSRKNTK